MYHLNQLDNVVVVTWTLYVIIVVKHFTKACMPFSAVLKADNSYNIVIDEQVVSSGSLLEDFT